MRLIVSNTGPLLHLGEAQALDLLRLAGEIHVPEGVETEVKLHNPSWQGPSWLSVDKLQQPFTSEASAWQQAGLLDFGEAEAVAFTRQLKADWLLTDDTAARLLAKGLHIEVHGSLGVVLWAAVAGHLDQAGSEETLKRLAESSLWVSSRVLQEALLALDKIFQS